jgi:hypothetical protein
MTWVKMFTGGTALPNAGGSRPRAVSMVASATDHPSPCANRFAHMAAAYAGSVAAQREIRSARLSWVPNSVARG